MAAQEDVQGYLTDAGDPRTVTALLDAGSAIPEVGAPDDPTTYTSTTAKYPKTRLTTAAGIRAFWDNPWESFVPSSLDTTTRRNDTYGPDEIHLVPKVPRKGGQPSLTIPLNGRNGVIAFGGVAIATQVATVPPGSLALPVVTDIITDAQEGFPKQRLAEFKFASRRLHLDVQFQYSNARNVLDKSVYAVPRAWLPYFLHFYSLPVFAFNLMPEEADRLEQRYQGKQVRCVMGKFIACPHPLVRTMSSDGAHVDRFHLTMKLEGIEDIADAGRGSLWMFFIAPLPHDQTSGPRDFYAQG